VIAPSTPARSPFLIARADEEDVFVFGVVRREDGDRVRLVEAREVVKVRVLPELEVRVGVA
jgi:hypothetical protein